MPTLAIEKVINSAYPNSLVVSGPESLRVVVAGAATAGSLNDLLGAKSCTAEHGTFSFQDGYRDAVLLRLGECRDLDGALESLREYVYTTHRAL